MDAAARLAARVRGYRSRTLEADGYRLHLLEARGTGSGPPVMMLHGIGSTAADYAVLAPGLRALGSRVRLPDFPGHGLTPPPLGGMVPTALREMMLTLADQLLDEPSVVIGNSLGGIAALELAIARPDRVAALVLVSPGGAPMDEAGLSQFVRSLHLDDDPAALAFIDRFLAARSPLAVGGPRWGLPARHLLAKGVKQRLTLPAVRSLLSALTPDDLVRAEMMVSLTMPVMLYWGAEDRVFPPGALDFWCASLPPHTHLYVPPDQGHAPFLDDPVEFTRALAEFLEMRGGAPTG